jgi:hypothetical protein
MPITTVSNLSDNNGRLFAIEVIGGTHQAGLRTSAYTLRVAYSSLAKTIHSIGQRGGKVVNVKVLTTPFSDLEDIPVASGVLIPLEPELVPAQSNDSDVLVPVAEVAPVQPTPETSNSHPESRRHQSKSKSKSKKR